MKLFLIESVQGIGAKRDVVEVPDKLALDELLPQRKALVATPVVLRKYGKSLTPPHEDVR